MTTTAISLDPKSILTVSEAFEVSEEVAEDMIRDTICNGTTYDRKGALPSQGIAHRSSILTWDFTFGACALRVHDIRA